MPEQNLAGKVSDRTTNAYQDGWSTMKASKRGEAVVMDFYTQMAIEGRAFQVRAGTITTPLVGDAPITDARAEFCVDATAGTTIIPAYLNISVRLGTGILHEYAAKSVNAVSTAGTAFVPLPLLLGGIASVTTARVAAHAVTVQAELATTARRHWNWANPVVEGAGNSFSLHEWNPAMAPTLSGAACFYVQIAASGTGPSYYANFDYVELATTAIT